MESHLQSSLPDSLLLCACPADLGTAFYHFGVDNYGDRSTPVVGEQIYAFQGHHQRPWTITMREPCNNLHKVRSQLSFVQRKVL